MILTAAQPAYLPWIGLFDKISRADVFVIFDAVPLERHGFSNRNQVKTQQGVRWLAVPVQLNGHLDKPISEIQIAPGNWRRKHLRTLEMAYAKAPYFDRYFPELRHIYMQRDWTMLAGLNRALLDWLLASLGIKIPIVCASEQDFRGTKSALVLDMCVKMGATEYIFGSQGRDYADLAAFEAAGIKVWFQDFKHPEYKQLHGAFVPNMSVLDLLLNEGPYSLRILKNA